MSSNKVTKAYNSIRQVFHENGLRINWRLDDSGVWRDVSACADYLPVHYTESFLDYQFSYFSSVYDQWADLSVVICKGSQPLAVWPLTFGKRSDGVAELNSFGSPVLPPLFVGEATRKQMVAVVQGGASSAHAVCQLFDIPSWHSEEYVLPDSNGISAWHEHHLKNSIAPRVLKYDLYTNLCRELPAIRREYRSRYKNLVNQARRLWSARVMNIADRAVWEEFRELHLAVAGRVTRSAETWELQYNAISDGSAFLVALRDSSERMIGAGFFETSRDEGLYAVAAYDRDLFDQPVGHLVQDEAIREMKQRGVRWYRIGYRPFQFLDNKATDKELSIAHFKEGFASCMFNRFLFEWSLQ